MIHATLSILHFHFYLNNTCILSLALHLLALVASLFTLAFHQSGKTGGFALPLLQILMQQKRRGSNDYYDAEGQGRISTLILCPTRELAAQTGTVLQRLISYLPNKRSKRSDGYFGGGDAGTVSIDVIYGGVPIEPQVARLAKKRKSGKNIDVLVATPGRLVDVLRHCESEDPLSSALERRILDAFDEKSTMDSNNVKKRRKRTGGRSGDKRRRRGGASMESSLTLSDIQEMDLDRLDDDGRATLHEMLRKLDYLVVDEADRLLGGAFKEDMDTLLTLFPGKEETNLKTLLFSATFPEQIEERVDRVLARISAGVPLRVSTSAAMLQRIPPTEDDGQHDGDNELSNRQKKHLANTTPIQNVLPDTAPKIHHRVIRLEERHRTQALLHLLDQNEDTMDRVLVFVATRYATEHVSRKLRRYLIPAAELHGKLDQDARERRLKAFRSGRTRVLVSTDLAARGIDVEGLPVVVNYDLPRSVADFTHRTGRTGRAGRDGLALSFVTARSESHFDLIEKRELQAGQHKQQIVREVLPGFEPDEASWEVEAAAATMSVPGAMHSRRGLEHDRMFGGVKGRRKSKKDKLREAAAAAQSNKEK